MDNIIWLIDDDESIRESMAFLLSGMGWEVKTFGSIDAFTTAHVKDSTLVGCLLLDMRMPEKGADVAGRGRVAVAAAAGDYHDRARQRRCLPPGVP